MQETINTMIEDENSHYIEVYNYIDHDVENKLKRESLLKMKKGEKTNIVSRRFLRLKWQSYNNFDEL